MSAARGTHCSHAGPQEQPGAGWTTGAARSGHALAPPHETAFSSTGRGGKSMTSTSGDTFPRQAGGRVCFGRRPRYPPWPAGGVRAQIYPRDALFFDGQGEKLISSAHQHHDTFFHRQAGGQVHQEPFSLAGRGKSPSQAHSKRLSSTGRKESVFWAPQAHADNEQLMFVRLHDFAFSSIGKGKRPSVSHVCTRPMMAFPPTGRVGRPSQA